MGASVGCEPSCVSEDLVVVKNPSTITRGTQAPRGYSSDESPRQDRSTGRRSAANEKDDFGSRGSAAPGNQRDQASGNELHSAEQQAWEAQQALPSAPALESKAESEAFSTLPLASKGVGTEAGEAELAHSPEAGGGVFGSQSSGIHTLLPEDSPRDLGDYGDTFGHAEAASHELVSAAALRDASPEELGSPLGTMDLPKAAQAEAERERSGSNHTIEKEPSILSGGTILPEDEAEAERAEAAAPGALPQGSTETAFSFAPAAVSQLRTPSDELAFAAAAAGAGAGAAGFGLAGASRMAAGGSREARPPAQAWGAPAGLSAHNPQEGTGSSMSQVVQGMRSSGAAASATRRQAAENRLAMLTSQGDAGSLVDAKMRVKEWQWQLKMEIKSLEREIKKVKADETKLHKQMQAEGQKGNTQHVQQLARTIVRSRRTARQLESTKVSMNDMNLQLTTCAAAMSMKHAVRASADAMQGMNGMASLEDLAGALEQLQAEKQRGLVMEDTVQEAFRDDEEDAEAALEVQKLLEEFELDRMGLLEHMGPAAVRGAAPVSPGTLAARQAMSSSAGRP